MNIPRMSVLSMVHCLCIIIININCVTLSKKSDMSVKRGIASYFIVGRNTSEIYQ